jgi:hypothetical protein
MRRRIMQKIQLGHRAQAVSGVTVQGPDRVSRLLYLSIRLAGFGSILYLCGAECLTSKIGRCWVGTPNKVSCRWTRQMVVADRATVGRDGGKN